MTTAHNQAKPVRTYQDTVFRKLFSTKDNSVELMVKVINLGYNEENEILKRSETLAGYSRILHYTKEGSRDDAAALSFLTVY